jgi:CheY-like chemotaxis protein
VSKTEVMERRAVLLVDDDFNEIMSFQKYLAELKLDHTLYTAGSDKEALEILCGATGDSEVPDLVLINLETSKLNAFALVQLIRNYYSLRHVKVFALTDDLNKNGMDLSLLDVTAVLKKPVNFSRMDDAKNFGGYNLLLNALIN